MESNMELMVGNNGLKEITEMMPETTGVFDRRLAQLLDPHEKVKAVAIEADMQLALIEKAIEVADEGVKVIKQIDIFNALDKAGALVLEKAGGKAAYRLRTKKERMEDGVNFADQAGKVIRENFPDAADAVDKVLADFIIAAGKEAESLFEAIKEMVSKPHGSKVKAGRFKDFRIVYAGSKSYIELGENLFLYLTPDCIKSVRFVRKKFRMKAMQDYYYYEIIFKDGSESYVRVSKKHKENLELCNLQIQNKTIFKELLSGETYIDDEE